MKLFAQKKFLQFFWELLCKDNFLYKNGSLKIFLIKNKSNFEKKLLQIGNVIKFLF